MIDPAALRRRPTPVDRSTDRQVALAGIVLAVAFLIAAVVSAFLPTDIRRGAWLPLHLALAGAASTAIAGVMPFFSAAFAAAPPSDARLRAAAVASVAIGAVGVTVGVVAGSVVAAVAGGVAFIGGIALVGIATVRPIGRALGPSRGLVTQGYVAALVEVGVGAALATLFLAGWAPIVDAWPAVRAGHAWLNLVGFVSLVIATTLLHFFPTVIGARIRADSSARLTVLGLATGPLAVALGLSLDSALVARVGALATIGGALALAVYAGRAWRTKARWTTDPGWHRFAMLGLVSGIGWFEVGIAIATLRVLVLGADPTSWTVEIVAGPLVAGWMGLAVLAAATHLIPAIGPGDHVAHARQRAILGRAATARLVVADIGVAALTVGLPTRSDALVIAGVMLAGVGLGSTAVLVATAVRVGASRRG